MSEKNETGMGEVIRLDEARILVVCFKQNIPLAILADGSNYHDI